jgi:hypothetical protein
LSKRHGRSIPRPRARWESLRSEGWQSLKNAARLLDRTRELLAQTSGGDTPIAQVNARRHASRCIAMQPKALAASEEARSSPRSSGYVGTAGLNIDIIENYESSTP